MIEAIKARLQEPAYDFIRTDAHLGGNILFLTLGGSFAYGTNVEDSDLDLRGCVRCTREELLGLSRYEQFLDRETDTLLYSFRKLIGLLVDCNPGAVELLGCRPEHYLVRTPAGDRLLAN
ncbi:MAG: DNA polymerase beta superfamily protein, partial [Oscillospiraceae bacterium]